MKSRNPLWEYLLGEGAIGRRTDHMGSLPLVHPERSTYVIGTPGTGKSTLLLNLILADIRRGDKGVVVLDPHGDLTSAVLFRCQYEQADRVIYFAPAEQTDTPLGLNPFEWHDPAEYDLKVGAVMTVFTHLWYGSYRGAPTMQDTLNTLARTLFSAYERHQTTFLHMLLALRSDPLGDVWREQLAECTKDNPVVAGKWLEWEREPRRRADAESSRNKIHYLISNDIIRHILCQPTSSSCFHFQETLGAKKVLLVNLGGLDEESQRLIGSLILTQILAMAFLRVDEADRVPCHVYSDEFHKFSPQAFVELINQTRKFKVFCTLAHQTLAQLNTEAKAAAMSCGNMIVFRVNPIDARTLEQNFARDGSFPKEGLWQLPLYEAMAKVACGTTTQQARVQTYPEQGEEDEVVAGLIRQMSRAYGRPRAEVEKGIAQVVSQASRVSPQRFVQSRVPLWWE